jgi:hypothetical protein
MRSIVLTAAFLGGLIISDSAAAQYRTYQQPQQIYRAPQQYYQPRVYTPPQPPPPTQPRSYYVNRGEISGMVVGGAVAGRYGGEAAMEPYMAIGGVVGGYLGNQYYNARTAPPPSYYYYAPAYGIQGTTPYMIQRGQ